jgi:hypothetical protein
MKLDRLWSQAKASAGSFTKVLAEGFSLKSKHTLAPGMPSNLEAVVGAAAVATRRRRTRHPPKGGKRRSGFSKAWA